MFSNVVENDMCCIILVLWHWLINTLYLNCILYDLLKLGSISRTVVHITPDIHNYLCHYVLLLLLLIIYDLIYVHTQLLWLLTLDINIYSFKYDINFWYYVCPCSAHCCVYFLKLINLFIQLCILTDDVLVNYNIILCMSYSWLLTLDIHYYSVS